MSFLGKTYQSGFSKLVNDGSTVGLISERRSEVRKLVGEEEKVKPPKNFNYVYCDLFILD